MVEEKKGFFAPREPKPTVEGLAQKFESDKKVIVQTMEQFSQISDKKFSELQQSIVELSNAVRSMEEVKNIPSDWAKTISTMKEIDTTLPDMSTIYSILMAYRNLSSNVAKAAQERTKEKLSTIKKEIVLRKIRNCSKCGQAIEEGEYYEFGGKAFCMSHKDEPISEQKTVLEETQ